VKARLGLPLIAKDTLKEVLGESLGVTERAASQRLGEAVFETMAPVNGLISPVPIGRAFVRRRGRDFSLISVGDGVGTCLRVAGRLRERGTDVEVVDACTFAPLDAETIRQSVAKTGRIGVVDIGWASYGLAAEIARVLLEGRPVAMRGPLLSWAPAGHAPAGCFAESMHYPSEGQIADAIEREAAK